MMTNTHNVNDHITWEGGGGGCRTLVTARIVEIGKL